MNLQDFFRKHKSVAIAFSGGVDSAYLLYAAMMYAENVKAYYVKSEFQPQFELNDAIRLADMLQVKMEVIPLRVLCVEHVSENPPDRCYYCKRAIFGEIAAAAEKDGFSVLLDGTNASDESGDRPGMKVLKELSVLSPLRECGLTKEQIRNLSREAGLFTWDKPAYACLATRISSGEKITEDTLLITEKAEDYLHTLGFTDFRVRVHEGHGKIQLPEEQLPLLLKYRKEILAALRGSYKSLSLDLEVRK